MDRYITRRYVAICWADAVRLAQLDGAALEDIKCRNVELLHRTEWWAWWSDERLTTAVGLPEELQPTGLSVDAIALIDEVWMGGAIAPQCSWILLAKVQRIICCKRVHLIYKGDSYICHDKLTLQLMDGEARVLYRCEELNRGVYRCDILNSLPN